jgi:hypothetical protein
VAITALEPPPGPFRVIELEVEILFIAAILRAVLEGGVGPVLAETKDAAHGDLPT